MAMKIDSLFIHKTYRGHERKILSMEKVIKICRPRNALMHFCTDGSDAELNECLFMSMLRLMIQKKFLLCFGKDELNEYEVTRGKRFLDGAFGSKRLSTSLMPYYDLQRDAEMEPSQLEVIPEHYAIQVKGTISESSVVTTSDLKKFLKLGLYDTLRAKQKIQSFVIVSNGIVSILPPQDVRKRIQVLDGSYWYDIFSKLEMSGVDVVKLMQEQFLYDEVFPISVVNTQIVSAAAPIHECGDGSRLAISLPLQLSLERINVYNTLTTDEKEVIQDVATSAITKCLDRLATYESSTTQAMKRKLVLGVDASKKICKR